MKDEKNYMEKVRDWNQLPRVRRDLNKVRKSLTGKLIFFFLIVILPVNVLMVIITSFVAKSYEQRIFESFDYQLGIYTKTADNQFSSMEKDMKDFLNVNNLVILMKGSNTDSMMDMVRFNSALSESDIWSTYQGMYYLWDRNKDIFGFCNMHKMYQEDIRTGIREKIRAYDVNHEKSRGHINQRIVIYENHAFLVQQYDYPFFSIGILYDIENILEQFYTEMEERIGELYLADSAGNLFARLTMDGFACADDMGSMGDWNKQKLLMVSHDLGFGNYSLIHRTLQSEYMKELRSMMVLLYALSGICFVAIPLLWLIVKNLVVNPVRDLCLGMEEVEEGNLEYQMEGETGSYQMDFLYYSFNHMVEELHRMVTESYEKEIERLQTDAINIRLQVNQHMLLNFLNTVYSLSRAGKKDEVEEFTLLLMNYFRYVLRQDMGLVTICEEMQFVTDYLKLQKIRFPGSFHLVYSIEDGAEELLLPQLLIENFVENTIKYGLVMGKEIEILINVRTDGEKLILSICDTGNGMPKDRAEKLQRGEIVEDQTGKHIGIWNCKRRLKYYYGDQQEMTITSSTKQGTQIWIQMLKKPLQREDAAFRIHHMELVERKGGGAK